MEVEVYQTKAIIATRKGQVFSGSSVTCPPVCIASDRDSYRHLNVFQFMSLMIENVLNYP